MWIENTIDNTHVLCITVYQELELQRKLEIINETIHSRNYCNVIISLAGIDMLTSFTISRLLELHNTLSGHGRMLVLCKVSLPVKGIFKTEGISSILNLAPDIFAAKAMIQKTARSELQHAIH